MTHRVRALFASIIVVFLMVVALPAQAWSWMDYQESFILKSSCQSRGQWLVRNVVDFGAYDCRYSNKDRRFHLYVFRDDEFGCRVAPTLTMAEPVSVTPLCG